MSREAEALLDLVGMADQAERAAAILAYGDLKRLELAIALAHGPNLLLMDEPTAGMAPKERVRLMQLTADIVASQGISVLFTEHDMDVVFAHAHRIMVLNRGELIATGSVDEIRNNPLVQEVYLGGGRLFEARRRQMADPMLELGSCQHLLRQGAHPARPVFSAGAGEVVALLGRNGAGKTTTMRSIMQLVRPTSGKVVFEGQRHYPLANPQGGAIRPGLRARRTPHLRRSDRHGKPGGGPPAAPRGLSGLDRRAPVRAVSQPRRTAQQPRQAVVGRRAADADHRPHADGQPEAAAARRTV
jgi:ABC-type branched-subunit amino acid transport system ATPase component